MLGLLNPGGIDLRYRSLYSRCCEFQHLEYGVSSLVFHSFESVFLYALACDAGAVDLARVPNQLCCRLRAGRRLELAPDRELGRLCAAFSVIAAENKTADALRDAPSVAVKVRNRLFRSRFLRARSYFSSLDARFDATFDGFVTEHLALEDCSEAPSLEAFCRPTAAAFGYLFGLMTTVLRTIPLERMLTRVGGNIGAAILACDCAQDWQRDQRDGTFNVVRDRSEAQDAIDYCLERLADARDVCASTFGPTALSASILTRVGARLQSRSKRRAMDCELGAIKAAPARKSVVLNATCCVPCGDGAVAVDSDECGKFACSCCCLAVCAISACNGRCCCCS
jgi:hypothetical protein